MVTKQKFYPVEQHTIIIRRKSKWDYKILLDEILLEIINIAYRGKLWLKRGKRQYELQRNLDLKNIHKGKRCFVVGNGPSLESIDLMPLKHEIAFFVNRAFLIPMYEYIQPKYHIICDPKLATGEWPVTFLDAIVEKNPRVTLLLHYQWRNLPQFKKYRHLNIYWLNLELFFTRFTRKLVDLTTSNAGNAVVEFGILTAVYMGIKDIYMLGVDGTGLLLNLLNIDSHVYGSNEEDLGKDMYTISKDLMFMSMSFRKWVYLDRYCERHGVNLVNLTEGSVISTRKKGDYDTIISSSS